LPKEDPPSWFLPKISLPKDSVVVCLDDDNGIHDIWRKKFKNGPKLIHLSTPQQLKEWVKAESLKYQDILYLSDFELAGFEETGLDLIEDLKLENTVLVTSYYAEKNIMEKCSQLGVRLIPKMLAGSVPIEFSSSKVLYDSVHLEDDPYVRRSWVKSAKKININLLSVSNQHDLFSEIQYIDKKASFYIDVSLGDDHIPGHDVAKKLFDLGFTHLYLATGYQPEKFKDLPYIAGVVDKHPIF
jgi:hypothetical protein